MCDQGTRRIGERCFETIVDGNAGVIQDALNILPGAILAAKRNELLPFELGRENHAVIGERMVKRRYANAFRLKNQIASDGGIHHRHLNEAEVDLFVCRQFRNPQ